ncbi:hypothetical protein F5050DRAFT_1506335 [Lentinula boryana]|uniref:Uncharacterized protein n=1 Tax=Lentinula boryana TaxID=40481 RepID=A0ABQ8QEV2_9AGAR|nr:hypothetical protein F5050DRAFT_1506335 [Lentinula boryana]
MCKQSRSPLTQTRLVYLTFTFLKLFMMAVNCFSPVDQPSDDGTHARSFPHSQYSIHTKQNNDSPVAAAPRLPLPSRLCPNESFEVSVSNKADGRRPYHTFKFKFSNSPSLLDTRKIGRSRRGRRRSMTMIWRALAVHWLG